MIATAGDVLMQEIRERPEDDTPRLIYADWCEDNGQPARAELIRVQIEMSSRDWSCPMFMYSCGENLSTVEKMAELGCMVCKRWAQLVIREREIFDISEELGDAWLFPKHSCQIRCEQHEEATVGITYTVRRGFVERISLPTAVLFMNYAATLFSSQPIREVVLRDCDSTVAGLSVGLWTKEGYHSTSDASTLPQEIYEHLVRDGKDWAGFVNSRQYPSVPAANSALSAACVKYGRRLAGLPDLEGV